MLFPVRSLSVITAVIPLALLFLPGDALALDSRFELDMKDLDSRMAPAVAPAKARKPKEASRILVRSTVAVPSRLKTRKGEKKASGIRTAKHAMAGSSLPLQSYRLAGQGETVDRAAVASAEQVWASLVPPSSSAPGRGVAFGGDNFSLSIDPEQFPTLTAQDGATILVDAGGRLPPLVKSLVQDRGEPVRIVTENPRNRKRFFASLLEAGGFFSVAENFTVDFGTDPQLTVISDFKVEKSPESLMKQDLVLLNVNGKSPTPPSLVAFLNRQGFQVVEPYSGERNPSPRAGHEIHRISAGSAPDMADRLISSLDIPYSRDSMIEMYGPGDSGLRLDIRADRFFEVGGTRYVVSYFNGDPVFYTLMRLLETRGYRVVILEERDDFRKVAEKLAGSMGMGGSYGRHALWPSDTLPYGVRVSGYLFRNPKGGGKVLLTDREIDPLIAELATLNGYTVSSSMER